jgi:hypothetical protein
MLLKKQLTSRFKTNIINKMAAAEVAATKEIIAR